MHKNTTTEQNSMFQNIFLPNYSAIRLCISHVESKRWKTFYTNGDRTSNVPRFWKKRNGNPAKNESKTASQAGFKAKDARSRVALQLLSTFKVNDAFTPTTWQHSNEPPAILPIQMPERMRVSISAMMRNWRANHFVANDVSPQAHSNSQQLLTPRIEPSDSILSQIFFHSFSYIHHEIFASPKPSFNSMTQLCMADPSIRSPLTSADLAVRQSGTGMPGW